MNDYNASHIIELSEIEHIRQNTGMYIGSTENINSLIYELLDNATDEVLAGYATIVGIFIDTKEKIIKVLDSGRGYPFDQSLPLEKDPPVLSNTKLFTSGKFKKDEEDSAYSISSGLHGVGGVIVYALSEWMSIEIYRDKLHATYEFKHDGNIIRSQESFNDNVPFATKIEFKPDSKYFDTLDVDFKVLEEKIKIIVANCPDLRLIYRIDGKDKIIKGSENDLIENLLSKKIQCWHSFEVNNKKKEKCFVKFGWEPSSYPSVKVLSAVNLARTHDGVHHNKMYNILRDIFQYFAKKHKFTFNKDDCLVGLRIYLNLHIVKTAFAAQVKTRLVNQSDISIVTDLESIIKDYFNKNKKELLMYLTRFQTYRSALQSKKLTTIPMSTTTRVSTKFTKLRDCENAGGELIIGEGDSAVGGMVQHRDPDIHAILPLRGVIPNAITNTREKLMKNVEVKDIINAIGTGVYEKCDIRKLRYSKIIIATDADPAGHWIASLLIMLFASISPDIIKNGHLYLCRTPLYAVYRKKKFTPLWTDKDVNEARNKNEKISHYKGLGEYQPEELKVFTLDAKTRILIQVTWSEHYDKLFDLFKKSSEKRKLVMGEWTLE